MNRMLISLASNSDERQTILAETIRILGERHPGARFSSCYPTAPVGKHTEREYYNGVALLETELPFDRQNAVFKQLERDYGRTPEARETGIVPLDIDIVVWNESVVRPTDLRQAYLKRGLEEIGYRF